jgi:ABC-type nitrate/sulfonate/bicarbonate transport system substrate-binding protein
MRRKTRYGVGVLAAALAVLAAACSSAASTSSAPTAAHGAKIDTTPVKVAFSDTPDVGDITVLAAMDMMRQQGYNINPEVMNGNAVNATAVATGSAQIGNLAAATLFKSIIHGDPFTMFAQSDDNEFAVVAPSSITTVQQLNGKVYGLAGPDTSTAALTAYTERTDHVKFKIVYVAASSTRASALLSGRITATPLELDDVAKILNGSGTKFHVLVNYAQTLPWLLSNVLYTTKSFEAAHKSLLQALVNDLAKADQQAYANPTGFIQKYSSLLSGYTTAVLVTTMKESAASRIWGTNDQLTASGLSKTLAFDQQQGILTSSQAATLKSSESSWFGPITPSSS